MNVYRVLPVVCLLGPSLAAAQTGYYLTVEGAFNRAPDLVLYGRDDDRPSTCDEYINPSFATVPGCTGPRAQGDAWINAFGNASGFLAGASLGYSFPSRLRLELNLSYRSSKYDETSEATSTTGATFAKLQGEILTAEDSIGRWQSQNLFVHALYEFVRRGPLTAFAGVGAGVGRTEAEWTSLWARNPDASRITTGEGLPNAEQIRTNLAGVASRADHTLSDSLSGAAVVAGLDYATSERLSVGFRARYVGFAEFTDEYVWDTVRDHPANLRLDGSEVITYQGRTPDTGMLTLGIVLTYRLGQ